MKWKSGVWGRLAVLLLPVLLPGCGVLSAPQVLALSMASTVAGGYANGAVMGGSTVGVIRNVAFADHDEDVAIAGAAPVAPGGSADRRDPIVQVARNAAAPRLPDWFERACFFPNASGRGLPCS
jgi:hypothetical protein